MQRVAQRDPAYAEQPRQFPLGGKPVARRVNAQFDTLEQPLDRLFERVAVAHGAEHRVGDPGRFRHGNRLDHWRGALPKALPNALSSALKTKKTTVIGVRIDASGYVAQFNALREL